MIDSYNLLICHSVSATVWICSFLNIISIYVWLPIAFKTYWYYDGVFFGGAEMKRGVISLPKKLLSINDGKRLRTGESLSIVDLNYFALYWDE
ncbi:TPA: hypothetical protein ACHJFC_002088, partial [Klebsiella pneumoniae]